MSRWVKEVEYSIDQGSTFEPLGHIRADGSDNTQEAASEETSGGVELYAGTQDVVTVMVNDKDKYAALYAAMKDDDIQGTIQLKTIGADGTEDTQEGYSVIVQNPKSFSPRTRSPFTARFQRTFV